MVATLHEYNVPNQNVLGFVTDNAAYCIKAVRDVLQQLYPNAIRIPCLDHVINLVGEEFCKAKYLQKLQEFCALFKSSFYKKGARKRRYLRHLESHGFAPVLAPVPVATRWNSYFETVTYHAEHFNLYLEFFEAEAETSQAAALLRVLSLLRENYSELTLYASFLADICPKITTTITLLESNAQPLAAEVWTWMDDIHPFLQCGVSQISFGPKTDEIFDDTPLIQRHDITKNFQKIFWNALQKCEKHLNSNPAKDLYKSIQALDPQQAPSCPDDYHAICRHIPLLKADDIEVIREWHTYQRNVRSASNMGDDPLNLSEYWSGQVKFLPRLAKIALLYIWTPVSSVDSERSFSLYKYMLTDRRDNLLESNVTALVMMYFNGDIGNYLNGL